MPKYKYKIHRYIGNDSSLKLELLESFLNNEGDKGNRIVSVIDETFHYTVITETEIIEYGC